MSCHVWLHVLHGLRRGHLLAYLETPERTVPIHRKNWPDVTPFSDARSQSFASYTRGKNLQFNYGTTIATFTDSTGQKLEGVLRLDRYTADLFQIYFKPEPYVEALDAEWSDVGLPGDLPALSFGDLLTEWSKVCQFDSKAMRRSILSTLEQEEQKLPTRRKWLTSHGVFQNNGTLITPEYIQNVRDWTSGQDEKLERQWTSSWVVGRDWLRAFCQRDPANRPFPPFWEKPTPEPPIIAEVKAYPSPLKGQESKEKQKRNQEWLELAKEIKQRHPDWTKSDVCRQVAKEDGESEKWDSIRRTLNRLDPNWDKKVGHS